MQAHRDLESGRSIGSSVFEPRVRGLTGSPPPPVTHQNTRRSTMTTTIDRIAEQGPTHRVAGRSRCTGSPPSSAPSCATSASPRPPNDADLFAEIKELLLQHKVLFFRDQDISRAEHVELAERFGPLEDHPVARQRPGAPGPGPDLQGPRQPGRAVRERLPLRRHLARGPADGLGAALRRGPGRRRRHHLGEHGRGLRAPARARQGADRGPARPAQHRGDLRCQHADRAAARPQGAVPGRRAPGRADPPRDRREGPVRQRVHDPLHQLPHRRERPLRLRLQPRAAASCSTT